MGKIGVLVLHGIGDQNEFFAKEMIEEVTHRLIKKGHSEADIVWQPVHWAPILSERENDLLQKLRKGNDLDFNKLRRFVIHYLTDAISYQKVPTAMQTINVYQQITDKIQSCIAQLHSALQASPGIENQEYPLVIMAHSLGCQMISNYIWDVQQNHIITGASSFERMETLTGIITFGNNMPLFTVVYNKIDPIQFPGASVSSAFPPGTSVEELQKVAKWLNFYDPDDILGYPLKGLSASYDKTVTEDISVNVGGITAMWNPASHSEYWTDNSFTIPVTDMLSDILDLL